MSRVLSTVPLTEDKISQAFPLIQAILPRLDFETWRNFAHPLTAEPAIGEHGIRVVRGETGYFCGLVIYRVERDLVHGAVLAADHFIALDLLDPAPVAEALIQELEKLADRFGCGAIHTHLNAAQRNLLDCFGAAGHHTEGYLLCRPLSGSS